MRIHKIVRIENGALLGRCCSGDEQGGNAEWRAQAHHFSTVTSTVFSLVSSFASTVAPSDEKSPFTLDLLTSSALSTPRLERRSPPLISVTSFLKRLSTAEPIFRSWVSRPRTAELENTSRPGPSGFALRRASCSNTLSAGNRVLRISADPSRASLSTHSQSRSSPWSIGLFSILRT